MNVIDRYCRGKEERFQGMECAFYLPSLEECKLLKIETTLREIFDKGRCQPFERVKEKVKIAIPSTLFQECDDIAAHVTERVMQKPLPLEEGATLPILLAFIKRAVGRHVIDRLRQLRKIEQRHVRIVRTADSEEHLTKNEVDEKILQGSSPFPADSLLEKMLHKLAERIAQEGDPKVRKKYHRQELVFFAFLHRREREFSDFEMVRELSERFGKDQRTIYRDIEEIKEYLRSLMSK